MLPASDLRVGLAIRIDGSLYRITELTHHAGQGKMGGFTHAKLRHVESGTAREWRFRSDEPVEDVIPERRNLQFLYKDERLSHFMHPDTFEQVEIENTRLGRAGVFLVEAMIVSVEFVDGRPVGVVMPDVVELKVADTASPARSHGGTNVWKQARLENGMTIMVPPFIASGEAIRVDVDRATYIERAHKK
ncbi:MAG TPA: elongation factor P [Vicinamibacterales bacterium]|nr:elongation factor P [Vicinamibacterales bacterium]